MTQDGRTQALAEAKRIRQQRLHEKHNRARHLLLTDPELSNSAIGGRLGMCTSHVAWLRAEVTGR